MDEFAMLRSRLLSGPGSLTASEMARLLSYWGYREAAHEAASTNQLVFFHPKSHHLIRLTRPRRGDYLKRYQLDQVIDELGERGLLP